MRLMFKRPLSDTWLDLDVPAMEISYTETLNNPGDITARIPLSYNLLKAEDGSLMVSEYETLMIVDTKYDGMVVALVDNIEITETDMAVSGAGLSVLTKGTPWLAGEKRYTDADPVKIFRDIWDHVLSYDSAKVGLRITGATSSPGKLGVAPSSAYTVADKEVKRINDLLTKETALLKSREADITTKTAALFKASGLYTVGQVKFQKSAPSTAKTTNIVWIDSDDNNKAYVYKNKAWQLKTGVLSQVNAYLSAVKLRDESKAKIKALKDDLSKANETLNGLSEEAGESYDFNWWTTLDLSQKVDELVEAGPFEFTERAAWKGEDLDLTIEVGSPKIGTRREELVFELGTNVSALPTFKQLDPYSSVFVLGSGEGSAKLRTDMSINSRTRVRRVEVKTDKDATTKEMVRNSAKKALEPHQRATEYDFDTVVVVNHPWARPTQYGVGDEIRITGNTPYDMQIDRWVRILEKTVSSESEDITLKVEVV